MRCAPNFGGGEKVIISMLLLCGNGGERGGRCCELDDEGKPSPREICQKAPLRRRARRGKGDGHNRLTRGSKPAAAPLHGHPHPQNPSAEPRDGHIPSQPGAGGSAGPTRGSATGSPQVVFPLKETSSRCRLQSRAVPLPPHTAKGKQRQEKLC